MPVAALVVVAALSHWSTNRLIETAGMVSHTHEVLTALEELLSLMKDAETGQRGYLLTADVKYLEPYKDARNAFQQTLNRITWLTEDNARQQRHLEALSPLLTAKFKELESQLIDLMQSLDVKGNVRMSL